MDEYKNIATKVNPFTYRSLIKICTKKGITLYEFLQMVCDTIVRYMSDAHNLTPDMEKAMSVFEHLDGWANAFNLADYASEMVVTEATYFVGDPSKKGVRASHIARPFMGIWKQQDNIQEILERTICLMFPERYKRMRLMAVDMHCSSLLEMIDTLIDEHQKDEDIRSYREDFEDCNRSDFGQKPSDIHYKRSMHKDVDAPDLQRKIEFVSIDTPSDEELNNEI